jgi:hypothetical protein
LIDYIVVGLGSQYESLQHSLTVLAAAGADNLSVEDFYSMLLSCEALMEQNSQAPDFSTSANAVARQGGVNRGGGAPSSTTTAAAPVAARPDRLVAAMHPVASSSSIKASVATAPTKGAVVTAEEGKVVAVAAVALAASVAPAAKSASTGVTVPSSAEIASTRPISKRTLAPGTPPPSRSLSPGSSTQAPPTISPTT